MNKKEINKKLIDKNVSFEDFYYYLEKNDYGEWDNVHDEEIIKTYCTEMMEKGIRISHIIEALENNQSKTRLYNIWLGNSMNTPSPINNKLDLFNALELVKK